jgi:hypothetical protein
MFVQTLNYILHCEYTFRQGRNSAGSLSSSKTDEKQEDCSPKKKASDTVPAGPVKFFDSDGDSQGFCSGRRGIKLRISQQP